MTQDVQKLSTKEKEAIQKEQTAWSGGDTGPALLDSAVECISSKRGMESPEELEGLRKVSIFMLY